MPKKNILIGAVLIVLIAAGLLVWYFFFRATVYAQDTVISGDLIVEENDRIIMKDGAKLTVEGDLTLNGRISCKNGPLDITVNGFTEVNGELYCERAEDLADDDLGLGITLIASGRFDSSESAIIASNGHVQVVSSEDKLATTSEALESLFEDIAKDVGEEPRVGPFIDLPADFSQVITSNKTASNTSSLTTERSSLIQALIPSAQAQEPARDEFGRVVDGTVRIGGKWIMGQPNRWPPPVTLVPTPPKNIKKIILNYDFGPDQTVFLWNWELWGPDGREGEADSGGSCSAQGKDGGDAMRLNVRAGNVRINNFDLYLGSGGAGGEAVTKDDCDPATAKGGNGGQPGNFRIVATQDFAIMGAFNIHPGLGGPGGDAHAFGEDKAASCNTENGGKATATGGKGADNRKGARVAGTVNGTDNITIDELNGGPGGSASAVGGDGSDGDECGCPGGKGGEAMATGGPGGAAVSRQASSTGGDGGDASAIAGEGGEGGDCGADKDGGNGGAGGDATSTPGTPGTGTTAAGQPGQKENELGGPGGNGGDGCNEGKGGSGGTGETVGPDGEDGKNLCPGAPKPATDLQVTPKKVIHKHVIGQSSCPDPIETPVIIEGPADSFFDIFNEIQWLDIEEEQISPEMVELKLKFNCNISDYSTHDEFGKVTIQGLEHQAGVTPGGTFFEVYLEVEAP